MRRPYYSNDKGRNKAELKGLRECEAVKKEACRGDTAAEKERILPDPPRDSFSKRLSA